MINKNNFTIGNQVLYTPSDRGDAIRAMIVGKFIDSVLTIAQGKYVIAIGEKGDGRRVRAHRHELEHVVSNDAEYFLWCEKFYDEA